MLCRTSLLAVGPVFLLAAAVLAGEPIYDAQARPCLGPGPRHLLRSPISDRRNLRASARLRAAVERVHTVHARCRLSRASALALGSRGKTSAAQMEEQPASRRLIFLRDLWPVFDGLRYAHHSWPLDEDKAASAKAAIRRDELLRRWPAS